MTTVTLGKYRHLSRCANDAGHFIILAIDHRANLWQALQSHTTETIDASRFLAFKQSVLSVLPHTPHITGVLTDPAYGIGAGIARGSISGRQGLLAPIEVTDYDLPPDKRSVEFIPHWSVGSIKRVGGDGVKLLLHYHPSASDRSEKESIVRQLVEACAQHDIPFFLEPITYSFDPSRPLRTAELRQITVEMVRTFCQMGVDVLKLHFPVNIDETPHHDAWRAACAEVDAACTVPWVLLSAGVPFDVFCDQAHIACLAGASGVIVGRAVWHEAVTLQGEQRINFIQQVMPQRMSKLATLCQHGRPWTDRIHPPAVTSEWYVDSAH
jgi:tagatose 1,6-diphosphate aldolase